VINGPKHLLRPYQEDLWKTISIDSTLFSCVKPCDRCAVPTVLPDQGKRDPEYEPIITMRRVRALTSKEDGSPDDKVYFGQNVLQRVDKGVIRVGDVVTVIDKKKSFVEKVRPDAKKRS